MVPVNLQTLRADLSALKKGFSSVTNAVAEILPGDNFYTEFTVSFALKLLFSSSKYILFFYRLSWRNHNRNCKRLRHSCLKPKRTLAVFSLTMEKIKFPLRISLEFCIDSMWLCKLYVLFLKHLLSLIRWFN